MITDADPRGAQLTVGADARITKAGHVQLRCLLVNCAHYILGPFGRPCALRTAGERIAARGGKSAKKRAVIAVARKLAVTLLALWKSGADYQPQPLALPANCVPLTIDA